MFNLEEELKKLPDKPGVYLMHDAHDNIIYIGKAKVLKNRVRQYFQTRQRSPKIERMISLIDRFEYIVVDTEIEALVLENNLIKEHHPKYNTMLMDDKTYPYVKITLGEDYPRVLVVRKQLRDKAKYFGPYPSVTALRETLELLRSIYKFRNCKGRTAGDGSGRTCLYHHMGQCMGPCMKLVSKEEYRKSIDAVMQVLNGNFDAVKKQLTEQMMAASEELKFEEAAGFRDLLKGIQTLENRQKITNTDEGNRDVIAIAKAGDEAVAQVFFIREGRMIGREHFHLTGVEHSEKSEIMTDFVKQYYAGAPNVPRELLLGDDIEDEELIASWLSEKSGRKVYIKLPRKGQKEKLVTLAEKNAAMVLIQDSERIKTEEARTIGAVRSLSELIGVPGLRRIESYDISNISGFESVGSMVVFEDGKSKKQDYRKFKIKTVVGPDDYASMREVLTRRFTHGLAEQEERGVGGKDAELFGFARFPDVILMDGGRGQVNIALSVLSELGISIAVCGMVKDDNHRTRGLYYNNEELPIDTGSELFKLITRIQDETHRFAIEYHRKLRTKKQVHSVLDDIEGIGEVRRRALMKRFVSIEAMREADYEDILALPEMNAASAQAVYDFFHRQ